MDWKLIQSNPKLQLDCNQILIDQIDFKVIFNDLD